jgi:hypothetical protein
MAFATAVPGCVDILKLMCSKNMKSGKKEKLRKACMDTQQLQLHCTAAKPLSVLLKHHKPHENWA